MEHYYWTFDKFNRDWEYENTIEDCIEEAKKIVKLDKLDNKIIYIGIMKRHKPRIYGDEVIELLQQSASNKNGECADEWLDDIQDVEICSLQYRLNRVLDRWLDEIKQMPTFGQINEVYSYYLESGKKAK